MVATVGILIIPIGIAIAAQSANTGGIITFFFSIPAFGYGLTYLFQLDKERSEGKTTPVAHVFGFILASLALLLTAFTSHIDPFFKYLNDQIYGSDRNDPEVAEVLLPSAEAEPAALQAYSTEASDNISECDFSDFASDNGDWDLSSISDPEIIGIAIALALILGATAYAMKSTACSNIFRWNNPDKVAGDSATSTQKFSLT